MGTKMGFLFLIHMMHRPVLYSKVQIRTSDGVGQVPRHVHPMVVIIHRMAATTQCKEVGGRAKYLWLYWMVAAAAAVQRPATVVIWASPCVLIARVLRWWVYRVK
jgi:hypothetical protein